MAHKTLRRFHGYDYSRGGSMFVTIHQCRTPIRGHRPGWIDQPADTPFTGPSVTGPSVSANLSATPLRGYRFGEVDHDRVILSEAGEIAKRDLIEAANHFYGFITLRQSVIMPNHVHFRFTWPEGNPNALKDIGKFVGRFKQFSQYHIAGHGPHIWQDGYHDILCVSERCNRTIDAYIANNPLKWWLMYCDKSLMHVEEPFFLPEGVGGEDLWRAVGNFDLLDSPRLVSLRISQKVPEEKLEEVVNVCVRGALEKGYVYVSTFFSPGERRVFKALAGLEKPAMVKLLSTYVDLAYRPHGDKPLLFAQRRLLLLSRMPDPTAEPSRGELVGLNLTAAELAQNAAEGKAVYVQFQGGRLIYRMS